MTGRDDTGGNSSNNDSVPESGLSWLNRCCGRAPRHDFSPGEECVRDSACCGSFLCGVLEVFCCNGPQGSLMLAAAMCCGISAMALHEERWLSMCKYNNANNNPAVMSRHAGGAASGVSR